MRSFRKELDIVSVVLSVGDHMLHMKTEVTRVTRRKNHFLFLGVLLVLQSWTTKVRIFYCARTKENWHNLISDSDPDRLISPENDFFVFFPRILGTAKILGVLIGS